MIKKLSSGDIINELADSSVFFENSKPAKPDLNTPDTENKLTSTTQPDEKARHASDPIHPSDNTDSTLSRNHAITHAVSQKGEQSGTHGGMKTDPLEEIRKAVKQLGKELSTHRLTTDEKNEMADIIYTYSHQKIRTSENEITRIGINWLLQDYRQNGANSVLAQLLERLHG